MSRTSLFITSLNGKDIPPKPKLNLGLAKIVTIDLPPMLNLSSNNIKENLQKENEELNYDLNVFKFIKIHSSFKVKYCPHFYS